MTYGGPARAAARSEDFPDPNDDGIIQFHGGNDTPEFDTARENCRVVLPEGLGASRRAPGGGR